MSTLATYVGLLAALISGAASAEQTVATGVRVLPAEQATRDNERLEILRSELSELEQRAEAAARLQEERLLARDFAGVDEAEAVRVRTIADIAALQREIESTQGSRITVARSISSVRGSMRYAAWWDVYARTPGRPANPVGLP